MYLYQSAFSRETESVRSTHTYTYTYVYLYTYTYMYTYMYTYTYTYTWIYFKELAYEFVRVASPEFVG